MLPKKYRLTFKEFIQNKQRAKKLTLPYFDLFIKPAKNTNSRFLVLTPKSIDKRSVIRHRTKRKILAEIKKILPKIKNNIDIMIKAKKAINKNDKKNNFAIDLYLSDIS